MLLKPEFTCSRMESLYPSLTTNRNWWSFLLKSELTCSSSTLGSHIFPFSSVSMIQIFKTEFQKSYLLFHPNDTFFKSEFTSLKVRSEPLDQHLPKVKDSKQEGPLPFMSGRLKSNINMWRKTTNDPFVLSVIQHGYRIQLKDSTASPQSEQKNSKNCLNHTDFITKSIEELYS